MAGFHKENQHAENVPLRFVHEVAIFVICAIFAELLLASFLVKDVPFGSAGRVTTLFLGLYTIHRFAISSLSRYRSQLKDLVMLAVVLVGMIVIVWCGVVVSKSLTEYAHLSGHLSGLHSESLYLAIPFACGGFLLQVILGLQYGLIFAVSFSLIIGVYFENAAVIVPYVLITTLVACLSLVRFRTRSAYMAAGLNVALISFVLALGSIVAADDATIGDIVVCLVAPIVGGLLCSFIAAGITPFVEHVGGYVTDMRLIEMATLDHPLLKDLSIRAPGTWNHSTVMGMMAEAAANEIGANPILARVSAYFHDIGKMTKPLYFVENQVRGENRHDKLSTSMSALIIRSHVKDGIELARKHKLPRIVEDMIPQHHGTSLIEYFYDKACKEAEEAGHDVESVDRTLYTYPGPKPQTKEAGILMLADGIEAAARTLPEPTLDRIQGMVQKLINKVFASGELNECELTLKDLHAIAKAFTRVLNGIYHQRIAYAEPVEKGASRVEDTDSRRHEEESTEPQGGESSEGDKETKKSSKEDLKRLGL